MNSGSGLHAHEPELRPDDGREGVGLTEHDGEHRSSRPFSVRPMAERVPALGATPKKQDVISPADAELAGIGSGDFPAPPPPFEVAPSFGRAVDPLFVLRETGEILFTNCTLGSSDDDPVGTCIFDWLSPDQHQHIAHALEEAFRSGDTQHLELFGIERGGASERWYDCRITPNTQNDGPRSATLAAHDITDLRETMRRLEESQRDLQQQLEEQASDTTHAQVATVEDVEVIAESGEDWARFRALMDHAGEAIFVTDPQTDRIVDVNETAARWLCGTRESLTGAELGQLRIEFPLQPPTEMEVEWTETRDTRRPLLLRGVHRRQDGTTFPVEVAVARHVVGAEVYVLAVAREVKGRQDAEAEAAESEQRYRVLLEQCWDAVYLTARNGQIEDANSTAVELFGYPKDRLIGLDARRLFAHSKDIKRFLVQMNTLGEVGDFEVELRTHAGETFEALLSATKRPAPRGSINGYQVIVRPLSEPVAGIEQYLADDDQPDDPKTETADPELGLRGAVLVATGASPELVDGARSLLAAGMRVLTAKSHHAALKYLGMYGGTVGVTVLDADEDPDSLPRVIREIGAHAPATTVILATQEDPMVIAERVADLGIGAIMQKPIHPLALIQRIRELD